MTELKLKILNKARDTAAASTSGEKLVTLVYTAPYQEGDMVMLELNQKGIYCEIQLDDAMKPAVLYIRSNTLYFEIPFGQRREAISPKAFSGSSHVLSARVLDDWELDAVRNLALNPYDGFLGPEVFPHADANVETRNEAVFAARNAIDGIYANNAHGKFPYGSWGINQRSDAEFQLDFGTEVEVCAVRLTLRADFPHDTVWECATIVFSDGSSEVLELKKTAQPQLFSIVSRVITSLTLKELKKADEASPFPSLTQVEVIGSYKV
ncbi:carbohydrate-binding protein [Lachnospiraceae bacterium OttesenSCG-928-D06]|nr:carbohydrate-binding protein [Lachnospiraceae bacterium OttesenSCG-928-D06]